MHSAARSLPAHLQAHRGFARTFQPGRTTLGLISPFMPYADSPFPDLTHLDDVVRMADNSPLAALWMRDVPFFDPGFGDAAQTYDTSVALGYLAATTKNVALGAAGYVSPLRDPIMVAKEAASVDQLSGGRFILGLSSGDRPTEYPVFAQDFDSRSQRFRDNWAVIRELTETAFPRAQTPTGGMLLGNLDLVPKPVHGRLPMVTIGRARQDMRWFATESDAWLWYSADIKSIGSIISTINSLGDGHTWHPFSTGTFLELLEDPNAPLELLGGVYLRSGAKNLVTLYQQQQEQGVAHIIANLKPTRRPVAETVQDFLENVVKHFPADMP